APQTVGPELGDAIALLPRRVSRHGRVRVTQRGHLGRDVLEALDDVVADLGPYRAAQVARLHREGLALELVEHHAVAEHADVASLVARGFVIRVLARQVGEPLAR